MVNLSSERVDRLFHALSDTTRRQMLASLARGEHTMSELSAPYDMSLAAATKHLRVLENARLISITKRGRSRVCRIRRSALRTAAEVIAYYEQFWNERLDSLAAHFEKDGRA